MNSSSLISVIVPTLGERPNELSRLLNSLSLQTNSNFEVIIISQNNFKLVESVIEKFSSINIKHLTINKRGLSHARNIGIENSLGSIIVLSDDDCWYSKDSFEFIAEMFNRDIDILLTKIYDDSGKKEYKKYSSKSCLIRNKWNLMSRSSIEIAFRRNLKNKFFDETFGLGATFVSGEEVDFLLNNYKDSKILYYPKVTVYHPKKFSSSDNQIIAKGALYSKHYGYLVSLLVLFRDLIIKRENNFKSFFSGYQQFKRNKIR